MDPLLPFHAVFKLTDKELVLDYEIQNKSARDIYMLDRIDRGTRYRADPNVVYVHLERGTKTIWLNKQVPEIPEGVHPTVVHSPYVTPLRAGATAREQVRVPLPVREVREYQVRPRSGQPQLDHYRDVYFTLQYYWRIEGMVEEVMDMDGQPVIVPRSSVPLKASDFGYLESERIAMPVPVQA